VCVLQVCKTREKDCSESVSYVVECAGVQNKGGGEGDCTGVQNGRRGGRRMGVSGVWWHYGLSV
jgi:hypothetical protein